MSTTKPLPPKTLTLNQVQRILVNLGWRIRTAGERRQAILNFQRGWALGPRLKDDSVPGPLTSAALRISESRRRRGLPTASAHFSFLEVRCRCGGRYGSCARIWFVRRTFLELEKYRAALGHGVSIVSGCRCERWNAHVGGASQSRHKIGDAVDFPPERPMSWFTARGLFQGRGWNKSPHNHPVRHGDFGPRRQWMYS